MLNEKGLKDELKKKIMDYVSFLLCYIGKLTKILQLKINNGVISCSLILDNGSITS